MVHKMAKILKNEFQPQLIGEIVEIKGEEKDKSMRFNYRTKKDEKLLKIEGKYFKGLANESDLKILGDL